MWNPIRRLQWRDDTPFWRLHWYQQVFAVVVVLAMIVLVAWLVHLS